MDEAGKLAVCVLGELRATRGGAEVELGGRRQRAVLAALIIARGAVVAAERLADCVWGEDLPANPAGALQSYVSHLRRALQPEAGARQRKGVIASAGPGYALRLDPDAVDAWRFERAVEAAAGQPAAAAASMLEDALALWAGPAYSEYAAEPWAEAEIIRLHELRAVARERLLAARLDLGDAALLVGELESLVAEDPLREERWRLLALALYRAHRQADALAALRRARDTLAEELGIDPGPALRALEREVLDQSPELDAPPAPARPLPETPSTPEPAPPRPPSDLVDRDAETALLRSTLDQVRSGGSALVVMEGPAGIGKTRLLVEALRLARSEGLTVLSARGSQLESAFGLGVARQLFEAPVADPARRDTLLSGAAAAARPVFENLGDGSVSHGDFAVLHGLYWLTANLAAEGPVVLAVDDVQWCDSASLRFLVYLAKRLEGLPVAVLVTLRTGEQHPDEALLSELALDPSAVVLRPQPLSLEATEALVRDRLGEAAESFVGVCQRITAGNPLLLRQLLRALETEGIRPDVAHSDTVRAVGSRAISSLVMLRLRRMPPDATLVARAVAVLDKGADLPTVAALAQLPEDRAAIALDLLARGEVLRDGQSPRFVHPLVRDAVYDDLPAAERALHHERATEVLQQLGSPAEKVAAHLLLAPRRGRGATVAVLRAAARAARERGAPESAVAFLRRALEEPALGRERVDVLVELGNAETMVDGPAAAVHLAEAYAFLDDPRERADLAITTARTHVFASPPGVATAFAREAASALPAELDDARQGLVALQRITGFMHGLPPATYRDEPRPAVSGEGDGARMLAATIAFELTLEGRYRLGAVELARFALAGDRLLQVDNGLLWVVAANVLVLADVDLGDFWDRASAHAHSIGGLFNVLSVNLWRGFAQWRGGHLQDALDLLNEAEEQHRMWGESAVGLGYTAAFKAGVLLDIGDLEGAGQALDSASELPDIGEGTRLLREAATRLLLAQQRPREALEVLAATVEPLGIANPVWAPWRGLKARALAGLGQHDEALRLVEEEVELLRRWGAPAALGPSLRLLGDLRGSEGIVQLREAVQVLSNTTARLELARAHLALGRREEVPDAEAVPLLTEALSTARICGARTVADEARTALEQRGQAPDDLPDEAQSGRQRQVFELAAAGLDVNEVAQRLFLTPGMVRTVIEAARLRGAEGSSDPQVAGGTLST